MQKSLQALRLFFILCVLLGGVVIAYISLSSVENLFVVLGLPWLVMLLYWYLAESLNKKTQEFYASFAESIYYLGFTFTLISLAVSVYDYDHKNINLLLSNFGIALTTTILGFVVRTCYIGFTLSQNNSPAGASTNSIEELQVPLMDLQGEFMAFNSSQDKQIDKIDELNKSIQELLQSFQKESDQKVEIANTLNRLPASLETLNTNLQEYIQLDSKTFSKEFSNKIEQHNQALSESLEKYTQNFTTHLEKLSENANFYEEAFNLEIERIKKAHREQQIQFQKVNHEIEQNFKESEQAIQSGISQFNRIVGEQLEQIDFAAILEQKLNYQQEITYKQQEHIQELYTAQQQELGKGLATILEKTEQVFDDFQAHIAHSKGSFDEFNKEFKLVGANSSLVLNGITQSFGELKNQISAAKFQESIEELTKLNTALKQPFSEISTTLNELAKNIKQSDKKILTGITGFESGLEKSTKSIAKGSKTISTNIESLEKYTKLFEKLNQEKIDFSSLVAQINQFNQEHSKAVENMREMSQMSEEVSSIMGEMQERLNAIAETRNEINLNPSFFSTISNFFNRFKKQK